MRMIPAVALVAISVPAAAQTSSHRSAQAATGQPLRLGVYATVKADCTPGPLPELKVLAMPSQGRLTVRRGRVKIGAGFRCPYLETPVQVVLYQSHAGYVGIDEVSYEVRSADGRVQSHIVRITVVANLRPGPEPPGQLDL